MAMRISCTIYRGLQGMIQLPRLEGKDWDRLSRRPYEYAIEAGERKGPCSLEQALDWARQKAGERSRPVKLAVLWDGEWRVVDIVCPSEFLAWSRWSERRQNKNRKVALAGGPLP
jgi:hypothetical protein